MKDIINPVDTEDGLFHDGDPSTGAEGTIVYAGIMNAIQGGLISTQSEIKTVLTAAGITPDDGAVNQLLEALKKLFASADNELIKNSLQKSKNLSDVKDKVQALEALNGVAKTQKVNGHELSGDVNVTAQEIGAVPTAGGNVGFLDNAEHYSTKSGVWPGGGAFQNQINDPRALFYSAGFAADGNAFLPITKAVVQTKGKGYIASISYGALTSGNAEFPSACIHILCDMGNGTFRDSFWMFNPNNGTFSSYGGITAVGDIFTQRNIYNDGIIQAGRGVYDTPGVRCYSQNNPPPQQDLSGYATTSWVMGNFLTNAVLGAEGFFDQQGGASTWTFKAPAGCMLTGMIARYTGSNSAHNIGGLYYKPILVARNGVWVQIGG